LMMLDILKNNDWERPIYFTGGSYDEEEYFWMKDYLQLEGLVYKLVPIRTPINPNNPYQMGRVDAQKMYEIVKKWDWGNAESPEIYHDPETRKNSISFRSNISRLAEALIDLGQSEKAIEVLDLAMHKMPLESFGYYSLLTPFVDAYYRAGDQPKAKALMRQLSEGYREYMSYYAGVSLDDQYSMSQELLAYVERYRSLVEAVVQARDFDTLNLEFDLFYKSILPFRYFYGDYDFYAELQPFVSALYKANSSESGLDLYKKIAEVYQSRLDLYASVETEDVTYYASSIRLDVEAYRSLLETLKRNEKDETLIENAQKMFDSATARYKDL
jgi:hypothetical protein